MGCGASNDASVAVVPEARARASRGNGLHSGRVGDVNVNPQMRNVAALLGPPAALPPGSAPTTPRGSGVGGVMLSPGGTPRATHLAAGTGTGSGRSRPPSSAGNRSSPAPGSGSGSAAVPAALSSFRNGPTGSASVRRVPSTPGGQVSEDELPPLKGTPRGSGMGAAPVADNVPPGSQIPGLNYCNAEYFPTHMEQCFAHYARPPEYRLVDKSGLKALADDAVRSYIDAARAWLKSEHPRWSGEKVETKVQALRAQFIPGAKLEDAITIATHYFAHELKYTSSSDKSSSSSSGGSGVTKPCFFLHFQRAHKQLYSFTGGADITLDRELLVQRLNKQHAERAAKAAAAAAAGGSSAGPGGSSGGGSTRVSSARAAPSSAGAGKSGRTRAHHKRRSLDGAEKSGRGEGGGGGGTGSGATSARASASANHRKENLFGKLDFGSAAAPTTSAAAAVGSTELGSGSGAEGGGGGSSSPKQRPRGGSSARKKEVTEKAEG